MAIQQVIVKLLDGSSRCFQFDGDRIAGEDVKARVYESNGVPVELLRLVTGTREINDDCFLEVGQDGFLPSCSVLLRLRGGKGGFGSLLRGAATKAGHKKTRNFDACRDMSGRRLRHVNAEKKLKEWKSEADERELEKVAEEHLKMLSKKRDHETCVSNDIEKYREQTEENMKEVDDAVMEGLMGAKSLSREEKNKKVITDEREPKRTRMWAGVEEESEGDSDEEEEEEEEEQAEKNLPDIESEEDSKEEKGESSGSGDSGSEERNVGVEESGDGGGGGGEVDAAAVENDVEAVVIGPVKKDSLDLNAFESSKELEALGMEKLKSELQERGLKCGGSLAERASRIFLLKSTPIDKLDKKHFAKAKPL